MKFKILICDKIADKGIHLMEEEGCEITKAWDMPKTELPKIASEYDAIIVRSATKVKKDLLDNAKKLRVIGRAGEGLDNIDMQKAREIGNVVVNTPHIGAQTQEAQLRASIQIAKKVTETLEELVS